MSDQLSLKCGSSTFVIPNNPTADSIVTCAGCGAKAMIEKMFKDAFKKWK